MNYYNRLSTNRKMLILIKLSYKYEKRNMPNGYIPLFDFCIHQYRDLLVKRRLFQRIKNYYC